MRVIVKRQVQTIQTTAGGDRQGSRACGLRLRCLLPPGLLGVVRPARVSLYQASIPQQPPRTPILHTTAFEFARPSFSEAVPAPWRLTSTSRRHRDPALAGAAAGAVGGRRKAGPTVSACCRAQAEPAELGSTASNAAVAVKPGDRAQRRGVVRTKRGELDE